MFWFGKMLMRVTDKDFSDFGQVFEGE